MPARANQAELMLIRDDDHRLPEPKVECRASNRPRAPPQAGTLAAMRIGDMSIVDTNRPTRNWWRWSTVALGALAAWQRSSAWSSSAEAAEQREQAALYRGRWAQVCYRIDHCSASDCRYECRTNDWCR